MSQWACSAASTAATNHPQLLDEALFRRFDTVIHFDLPDQAAVQSVICNRIATFQYSNVDWAQVTSAARGLSHAEVSLAAANAGKRTVLSGRTRIITDDLVEELAERFQQGPARGVRG